MHVVSRKENCKKRHMKHRCQGTQRSYRAGKVDASPIQAVCFLLSCFLLSQHIASCLHNPFNPLLWFALFRFLICTSTIFPSLQLANVLLDGATVLILWRGLYSEAQFFFEKSGLLHNLKCSLIINTSRFHKPLASCLSQKRL